MSRCRRAFVYAFELISSAAEKALIADEDEWSKRGKPRHEIHLPVQKAVTTMKAVDGSITLRRLETLRRRWDELRDDPGNYSLWDNIVCTTVTLSR